MSGGRLPRKTSCGLFILADSPDNLLHCMGAN